MTTMKPETWRAQADRVKAAIASSTCSPALVTELQELLAPRKHNEETKENIKPTKSKPPVAGRTKTAASARAKTKALEIEDRELLLPTPKERFLIATAVVNISLKALTDALKSPPKPQRQISVKTQSSKSPLKSASASPPRHPRSPLARSASCPQRPLQPRSNSQISSVSTNPLSRRSSSYSLASQRGPAPNIIATAECARLAFTYLRSPEGLKAAGDSLPPLQLENGMLALTGKLLSHGLESLAVKELQVLKRRLQRNSGKGNGSESGTSQQEKETLASLIQIPGIDASNSPSELVITYQSYVLRTLAAVRRPQVIEAIVEHLEITNPASPFSAIAEWSNRTGNEAKTAKYLETLAQAILALCPNISSAEDSLACNPKIHPSAEAVLQLQRITFQVRLHWAKLTGKEDVIGKELLEMFSKCLAAFARRSSINAKESYELAERQFDRLQKTLESLNKTTSSSATSAISKIYRTLSSLAQTALLQDEALRWMGDECAQSEPATRSEARNASHLVRIAALSLDKHLVSETSIDVKESLDRAIESLKGSLRGDSTDLDGLLCEVTGLRRIATKPFLGNGGPDGFSKSIQRLCFSAISACVRFLVRYVGSRPAESADPKAFLRHGQRLSTVKKVAKGVIDCAVAACRAALASSAIQWEELDACLNYCVALVNQLQGGSSAGEGESLEIHQSLQFPLVKISNIYWTFYLHLRKSDSSSDTSMTKIMRKSIDALKDRTPREKESGSFGMKLEKFAEALQAKGAFQEAHDALSLAIESSMESNVLHCAVALADKQPLHAVWESSAEMQSLARVLLARSRLALRLSDHNPDQEIFFDDENMDAKERGLLAEWQLNDFPKLLRKQRTIGDNLRAAINRVLEALWSVYPVGKHPIRRLRVATVFLQLVTDYPSLVDFELPSELAQCEDPLPNDLGHDSGLVGYGAHVQAAFKASSALQEASPSIDKIKEALAVWYSILDDVEGKSDLSVRVDDLERWSALLEAVTQFLAVKGSDYLRISALQLSTTALELSGSKKLSTLVMQLSELGLQYLRLGYSGKAGMNLGKAQGVLDNADVSTEARLQWHLAYAEYLLSIGNLEKTEITLLTAENIGIKDAALNELAKPTTSLSGRIRFMTLLSDASYVHSLFAMQTGHPKEALKHAKHCVTLNRRIWASIENRNCPQPLSKSHAVDSEVDQLAADVEDMTVSTQSAPVSVSMTHASLAGSGFWPIVPSLYRGLTQLATVLAHLGDFQQSIYYLEQAYRIADAVKATNLIVWNLSARADSWMKGGELEKAHDLLEQADPLVEHVGQHKSLMLYHGCSALVKRSKGEWDEEMRAYSAAESMLEQLSSAGFIQRLEKIDSGGDALVQKTEQLSLDAPAKRSKAAPGKSTKAAKPTGGRKTATTSAAKVSRKAASKQQPAEAPSSVECQPLSSLRGDLLRRRAIASLLQSKISEAGELLALAERYHCGREGFIAQNAANFRRLMSLYTKAIASDFTYSVLPESTISFPAVANQKSTDSLGSRHSLASAQQKGSTSSSRKSDAKEDFVSILRQAKESLSEVQSIALQIGSVSTVNQICTFTSQITILLSAANLAQLRSTLHPLQTAYLFELPKAHALTVEQQAVEVENYNVSRGELLTWPTLETGTGAKQLSVSQFQKDCVDIIPENWTAISMSLNEDRDELYITRYRAHETPFILRLPLARHQSRDLDEDTFGFDDGKAELIEIIDLSDFSSHSGRDMSAKGAKTEWWAEREALDNRLRDLLVNIENIWLGGFRGVFSQHARQPNLLARFQKSFQNILDRHLPSRRGRSKAKQNKTQLDPRILELFVGLGDATDGQLDLDEPLMDLVYFVVDVLQFSGERNAYDEIDFDAVVVETMDALQAYHGAAQKDTSSDHHTILILDKSLHCFPWESLPSLQGQSISRLPSLAALRERLLSAKRPTQPSGRGGLEPGHYASARGTSILNPSGDLIHTQRALQPCLKELRGDWQHIVARPPTEEEFERTLKDRDLLLYFGHGSGAQYIRSRTIKRLYVSDGASTLKSSASAAGQDKPVKEPNCSATWLMGCSSAAITEHGTFEPSGTICSYLTAGAPAVLGMLWDVTDKDCDRFSVKCGELWGLWDEATATAALNAAKKGKKVATETGRVRKQVARMEADKAADAEGRERLSLDQAVARSRDACYLRYLNGAAAVVYGIPVFLN